MLGILITLVVALGLVITITDALYPWIVNYIALFEATFINQLSLHIAGICEAVNPQGPEIAAGSEATLSSSQAQDICSNPPF